MKTILIAYATKEGQTKKVAEYVAGRLRELGASVSIVDVIHSNDFLDCSKFDAVIVAASIHMMAYEKEMIDFAIAHKAELAKIPTTFLSISLSAHGAHDEQATPEQRAAEETKTRAWVEKFIEQTKWHPNRVELVAGALKYTEYNFLVRFMMKQIAKSTGLPTDTSRNYEYTDWRSLDHLADEIAGTPAG